MALEPVGGKYEGVWINKLKNGDISYYVITPPTKYHKNQAA